MAKDRCAITPSEEMNPLKEFALFEGKQYAVTTRRVYLAAAKKALRITGKGGDDDWGSYQTLLAFLRDDSAKRKFPKGLKLGPFLSFLDSKIPKEPVDYGPIRTWVADRVQE